MKKEIMTIVIVSIFLLMSLSTASAFKMKAEAENNKLTMSETTDGLPDLTIELDFVWMADWEFYYAYYNVSNIGDAAVPAGQILTFGHSMYMGGFLPVPYFWVVDRLDEPLEPGQMWRSSQKIFWTYPGDRYKVSVDLTEIDGDHPNNIWIIPEDITLEDIDNLDVDPEDGLIQETNENNNDYDGKAPRHRSRGNMKIMQISNILSKFPFFSLFLQCFLNLPSFQQ